MLMVIIWNLAEKPKPTKKNVESEMAKGILPPTTKQKIDKLRRISTRQKTSIDRHIGRYIDA